MRKVMMMAMLLAVMVGCKKQGAKQQPEPPKEEIKTGVTKDDLPVNPLNPYDGSGLVHNKALEAVWQQIQQTADTSAGSKMNAVVEYFRVHEKRDVTKVLRQAESLRADVKRYGIQKMIDNAILQSNTKVLLKGILNATNLIGSRSDYADFIKQILKLESVALRSGLPEHELKDLLKVAAIARYSAWYWKDKTVQFPTPEGTTGQKRFWRFLASLSGDIMGAALGIFTGDIEAEASYQSGLLGWYADAFI